MSSNKLYLTLKYLSNVGINVTIQSLGAQKNIRILNRINVFSIVALTIYAITMFLIGFPVSGILCVISVIGYILSMYFTFLQRRSIAKYIHTIMVFVLITGFSVLFGKGIGSEYWVIICGSLSLLIFRQRKNAVQMVLWSLLVFLSVVLIQNEMEPLYTVDESIKQGVFLANIISIFIASFMLSLILRYSSEKFEKLVVNSNRMLHRQNEDLTSSINYAKRIQDAILPPAQLIELYKDNFFVLFEPKDIVSGDFYWIYPLKDKILFAVVDGAGHGVPGALTSIISHTLLSQCVEEYKMTEPLDIFNQFKELIEERKDKWENSLIEDMDVSICGFDWYSNKLSYASNGNFIYLIKHVNNIEDGEDFKFDRTDRYAMKEIRNNYDFHEVPRINVNPKVDELTFRKDDMLYLATNGLSRQLGGPKYKKLKSGRLKDLLMSIQHQKTIKQEHIVRDVLKSWKGKLDGTDDVTLIGFKV